MENVATWITPLLLLPGVALLIMSTSIRYSRIHDEFHHLLEHKGSLPHTPVHKLLKRSRFFRNALVSLYFSFGLFSLASLLGGLTVQWHEVSEKIVMVLTCLGILIIIFASYELISESLLSWDIIKEHSEEANRKD